MSNTNGETHPSLLDYLNRMAVPPTSKPIESTETKQENKPIEESKDQEPIKRVVFSIDDIIAKTGISRKQIYNELNAGNLRAIKLAGRTVVKTEDFDRWVNDAPPVKLTGTRGRPSRPAHSKRGKEKGNETGS